MWVFSGYGQIANLNLNLNNSSQSRNCDITGTSQVSALSNDSYGRVLGCTFSLLLKACTVAADVEFSGSLFHCGMVFAGLPQGFTAHLKWGFSYK